MDYINEEILNSDCLIFGTPVRMGYATGIMMTFKLSYVDLTFDINFIYF